ncbi:MAG: CBS domain-containing protein [Nitrososphaerota archaeon]|nr:CBS domain-containing protein [Nitrososphaerota archaeon]
MQTTPKKLKELSVVELMEPVRLLSIEDTASRVIGNMVETNAYEAFVEQPGRTAMISIRDVLDVRNITTTKISLLMRYIPRLNQYNTVSDAATLMFEHRIRSLPIYEGEELKGQISSHSIVKKLLETESKLTAKAIMTPEPICIEANDNVSKARQIMKRRKIDQIPILRDGKLYGVVTSEAVVANILPPVDRVRMLADWRSGRLDIPATEFAPARLVTNEVRDSLQDVFANMSRSSANYSVITNMGEVQGIITYRDFMKLLLKPKAGEDIPMYIIGLPEDPFEAEAAREKFQRVVQLLWRGLPEMTEARAIIKAGETKAARKKFRVSIFIMSPYWRHSYSVFGYELPDAFDYIEIWGKKLISKHQGKRRRERSDSGLIPESERFPVARKLQQRERRGGRRRTS